ncbi:MAG: hypothetical protein J7623_21835 [Chitinophaga sp.]|uniref:DUF6929 family protein n=1 Tax=Chitinophaga sp. TaxID=1869181 RepID=UPI001B20D577|nr:hypothetical protein [Chitinophaga sp.]MBO9731295.1 hypothetical protein [Chitinophaga sp.]
METSITVLHTLLLPDFPSASAIIYADEQLYLVGDDATCILVLDRHYGEVARIPIAEAPSKRIAKALKQDFEAATVITRQDQSYLLVTGSLSTPQRCQLLLMPLPAGAPLERFPYPADVLLQLTASGVKEWNIEGATVIGNTLLLGNRGHDGHPVNQLVLVRDGFWEQPGTTGISVLPLTLATPTPVFAGVSDLCYVPEKDWLLCTLSSEATASTYDDGAVGDSYIGWVTNISKKLSGTSLVIEGWLNLATASPVFNQEKIEGICVERVATDHLLLHLVSDNDGGESGLFKIRMSFTDKNDPPKI